MRNSPLQNPETILIHDLEPEAFSRLDSSKTTLAWPALPAVAWCRGCFGCWVKTPGRCLMRDRTGEVAAKMAAGGRLVVISRLVFGGLSPAVKALFDRSIGYILPFFRLVGNRMRHERRYERTLAASYIFYGPSEEDERDLAKRMAQANVQNLDGRFEEACFFPSAEALLRALSKMPEPFGPGAQLGASERAGRPGPPPDQAAPERGREGAGGPLESPGLD
ncbi:MAG: hypothetical protein LBE49_00090 [Deltaproteobacteria bacterium]|jgi:hypothetical protein|nr:hypothetical protein [Deltaproteobacteria bacterium]